MAYKLNPRRLSKAVDLAFLKMETVRQSRMRFLKQYVGRFFGHTKNGSDDDGKASPINSIYNAISTYVPNLVFNDPLFQCTTRMMPFRSYAEDLGLAVNHVARDEIRIKLRLRRCIVDAMFLAGFMKTGIADSGQVLYVEDEPLLIGKPFAEPVDPDDMVLDPVARHWDEQYFKGNRYRVPKEWLMESGMVDPDKAKALTSRYDQKFSKEAASLSHDKNVPTQYKDVCDYVELVDIYVPSENAIHTLPWTPGGTATEYLRSVEYAGPDTGPYHMLGFQFAPDNLLPIPPVGMWYDLHVMTNKLARKIGRQADRLKRVLAYEGGATEDALEIAAADDGETVRVDNVDAVKEINFGGVTEEGYAHMEWLKAQFQEMSGNVDQLSGAQSDTPTLGQAEILQSNASVRLADAQGMVYAFTEEIGRDLMFFLHTDPLIQIPLVKRVDGIDQQVIYSPDQRAGEWLDYSVKCKPLSMARTDPNVQVRRILEFAQSVVPAAAQAFQLLGPAFNIEKFLVTIGQKIGIDELDDIINSPMLQQMLQAQMQAIPPDGNLGAKMGLGTGMMDGLPGGEPMMPGGGRPQQPNPGQMGPSGGVSPDAEGNQMQQEASAANQKMNRPSVQQMAMAR